LFIFGQSFKNRVDNIYSVLVLIKKYFPQSLIYNINLNCNTESLALFGNRLVNTKAIKNTSHIFAINLEDNILTRKLVKKI